MIEPFSNIEGFAGVRRAARGAARVRMPPSRRCRCTSSTRGVGPIAGVQTPSPRILEITLARPYPQILYWFAMEFTAPVPWEAIAYYDGEEGRPRFDDHPVGSGPFQLTRYDKEAIFVLEKSPNWYGVRHPEWQGAGGRLSVRGRRAGRRRRPPGRRGPAAPADRSDRDAAREGGHPALHQVHAGLLRQLGHRDRELRPA